jgi:hypothetical protein
MDIVRRVNAEGATVILVEQSVNRAMTLAEHAFFLERGEVRFDGSITDLLSRDDLLRPVFLASVGAALGNGAPSHNGATSATDMTPGTVATDGTSSSSHDRQGNGAGARGTGPDPAPAEGPGPDTAPQADGLWVAGPEPSAASGEPEQDGPRSEGRDGAAT